MQTKLKPLTTHACTSRLIQTRTDTKTDTHMQKQIKKNKHKINIKQIQYK